MIFSSITRTNHTVLNFDTSTLKETERNLNSQGAFDNENSVHVGLNFCEVSLHRALLFPTETELLGTWSKSRDRSIHCTTRLPSTAISDVGLGKRDEEKKANILLCIRARVLLVFWTSTDRQCPLSHHCWNVDLCGLQVCDLGSPVELPQYPAQTQVQTQVFSF